MIDLNNIPYNDDKVWNLICQGHTAGIFQLESDLGSTYAKKIKPRNIEELSAILAVIRPACLNSGLTEEYVKIKNGASEKYSMGDADIDKILEPTYSILLYQEQLMQICSDIAWGHLSKLERLIKADEARKGFAKKQQKVIIDLKPQFIEGFVQNNRSKELAEKVFKIMEAAGRYVFNRSHAIKYAHIAYKTAYLKTHYPYEFYSTYLSYSREKQKPHYEVRKLINEARMLNITVLPPSVKEKNKEFRIVQDNNKPAIIYGLSHIKNVGTRDIEIIKEEEINDWQSLFLLHFDADRSKKINLRAMNSLISCGACDYLGVPRLLLLEMFNIFKTLSGKETSFIVEKLKNHCIITEIPNILEECSEKISVKKRKDILKSEAKEVNINVTDTFEWKANKEKALLGMALTCSMIDGKNVIIDYDCKKLWQHSKGNKDKYAIISAVLEDIKTLVTKRGRSPGQEMAQLSISDNGGFVKVACFPDSYEIYKNELQPDLCYEFILKGTGSGWAADKIKQIN